jgi:uncharacterized MAPEG superfamily protein
MTTELTMLVWATGLTGILWVPYVLAIGQQSGLMNQLKYKPLPDLPDWVERAKAHHRNSVENLVIFAALIITAHLANENSAATASAAITYFWSRLAHLIIHYAGLPYLRTIAFFVSWLAMACIFYQIVT